MSIEPAADADFKTWLQQAWQTHADTPDAAMAELRRRAPQLPDSADGADALRLAEHLWLVHQGDAAGLQALLPQVPAHAALAAQRRRTQWVLDTLAARPAAALPEASRLRGLHSVVMVLLHRGDTAGARRLLLADEAAMLGRAAADNDDDADTKADADADADADALRGYAATAHNTSNDICDLLPREPARDALMLEAAALAHRLWSATGAWLNIERADYQLARCHAVLGQGEPALRHAQACLARCEAEGADAVERFFAHEVLARAHQALGNGEGAAEHQRQMRTLLAAMPDDDLRAACVDALAALGA
ncbi:MAG: hypothetical protein LCI02_18490 [Proteobacteria bacterium]|nr:hypothetical protein [Pseudomonadota bacterium]